MGYGVFLFNGIGFGIEHMDGDEEEGLKWAVTVDILCFRFMVFKLIQKD